MSTRHAHTCSAANGSLRCRACAEGLPDSRLKIPRWVKKAAPGVFAEIDAQYDRATKAPRGKEK